MERGQPICSADYDDKAFEFKLLSERLGNDDWYPGSGEGRHEHSAESGDADQDDWPSDDTCRDNLYCIQS